MGGHARSLPFGRGLGQFGTARDIKAVMEQLNPLGPESCSITGEDNEMPRDRG